MSDQTIEDTVVEDDWLEDDVSADSGDVGGVGEVDRATEDGGEAEQPVVEQPAIGNGSPVYEDLRSQISSGDFKLQAMLDKLTRLYIDDMLTEEEYDNLMQFARDNANPDKDIEDNVDIIKQLMQHVTMSEEKLKDLEARIAKLEDPEAEPEKPTVTYEEYDPHKWYYKDMTCSFEGRNYICIAPEGVVCTWSPAGYPSYWKQVE